MNVSFLIKRFAPTIFWNVTMLKSCTVRPPLPFNKHSVGKLALGGPVPFRLLACVSRKPQNFSGGFWVRYLTTYPVNKEVSKRQTSGIKHQDFRETPPCLPSLPSPVPSPATIPLLLVHLLVMTSRS